MTRGRSARRPPRLPFGERSSTSHVSVCSPEEIEALLVSARGRLHSWWALWVSHDGRVRLSRVTDAGVVLFDDARFPYLTDEYVQTFEAEGEGVATITCTPLSRSMGTCGLELLTWYTPARRRWLEGVLASLRGAWWRVMRGGGV